MTVAPEKNSETAPVPAGHVKLTIDEREVIAPKGELVIRAAERLGIVVPRFCDHPLLEPAGACRQCLVDVEMGGRPMPKPQASCTLTVADGMVVRTQHTSPVADKAQQGVMELLLINHPLDCPICDKGGECPLQNQALKHGRTESRFVETKRTFPKPIPISTQVLLDRERCVLCQRCTRFSDQIAGDPFIELLERGAQQQIGIAEGKPFQSYFSGNTIQICPVGALTSAAYRFRSRPFDLVSTPGVCEHCAGGCATRVDTRRGKVMRRLAGDDPEVNEEWLCDKGRFAFVYPTLPDRIRRPLVRDESGELVESSWTEALRVAADGLAKARDGKGVGVLPGGRLTVEDAYAYSKFARVAARTNDIDFRSRPHSDEELALLSSSIVGVTPDTGVTYGAVEAAPAVLCVGLEPEEEAGILFLRLRKAARTGRTKVFHLGQYTTPAVRKTFGTLIPAVPGGEPATLRALPADADTALRGGGAVVLLGARAVEVPGLISAAVELATATGATLAWIPRRAGERGAVEAGALPTLLPGGRPVTDSDARAEIELAWGVEAGALPATAGRDAAGILAAAVDGELDALLVGGVDPGDFGDPAAALAGVKAAGFVVSLELRHSAVTEHADVVLPVAASVERAGSYLNWEGRRREFKAALDVAGVVPDCRVLDTLAIEMDSDLFTQTPAAAAADLARLGTHRGARPVFTPAADPGAPLLTNGHLVLASWTQMLGNSSLQDGEPALAGTARPVVARLAPATADKLGLTEGAPVSVATEAGSITLPLELADLPEQVVWLPGNSGTSTVRRTLGAGHGALVTVTDGGNA
ncbi:MULTISPECIES: NADH-quinone oxidoreductase subunit G [unclassified Crossiella]|uniref:NADH-quinone oxidoreductase subunit G n=1 Tax=unclassified Crossiella TaxID=2620835 RepID=UPI001FFF91F1|nr:MULTISPECIES: NADH-quinone oxidoreductase subunit G [unclassified Crossiella]MCK2236786.1 NADH-quinone oxidoreductase subunit G [Crossiella sp. S99.2]MCK2250454.1 NADH-quinone oxidoreductase subunit G [Crossiella sp. S99.1]